MYAGMVFSERESILNNVDTIAESRLRVSLDLVQFPDVLETTAHYADTEMGKKRIRSTSYLRDEQKMWKRHTFLREVVRLLHSSDSQQISLQNATEIARDVGRAAKGGILSAEQLLNIGLTLKAAQRAKNWITTDDYPVFQELLQEIPDLLFLSQNIFGILNEDGTIRDSASPTLKQIRHNIQHAQMEIDRILEGILRSSHWAEYIQDTVVTIREGRRVIPVKAMFRHQVSGIVHDRSASGQTVFVEPMPVVQKQNQVTELHHQEEEEIRRLLAELSHAVGGYHHECVSLEEILGDVDELLAIARYGIQTQSVIPQVGGGDLLLIDARHPLIENPVPLYLSLAKTQPILIVTGPNTGGKTVALKTTGLVVSLALSGMMVPCAEGTSVPFFDRIWVDIGDEQSIEQNLSTFSSHMARLIPMMEFADDRTLCLIDEIGAGTDPDEGSALAESMIHHLRQQGVYAVVTTHYSRLKLLGFRLPDVENAQVAFDRETLTPLYHLIMGQPGSSHALYIAGRLGMSQEIVQRARRLMDEEGTTLADVIDQANHLQMELQEAKKEVSEKHQSLQKKMQELDNERQTWIERNEREKLRMRQQWESELRRLHDEMMDAIDVVKKTQGGDQARAIESLREIWRQRGILPTTLTTEKPSSSQDIVQGDYVHVRNFEEVARVLELSGKIALVEVGTLRVKLPVSDLQKTHAAPSRSPTKRGSRTALAIQAQNIRIECDVRGMTVDEMVERVDKYLDDAVLAGAFQVRIIHGKGTGTLRRALAEMLKSDSRVDRYRLGERGEGGDGVTVVTFEDG